MRWGVDAKLMTGAALKALVQLHMIILLMAMVVAVLALGQTLDLLPLCLLHLVATLGITLRVTAVNLQSPLAVTDDLRSEHGSFLLQPARILGFNLVFASTPLLCFPILGLSRFIWSSLILVLISFDHVIGV
jgi:hypothetical protein